MSMRKVNGSQMKGITKLMKGVDPEIVIDDFIQCRSCHVKVRWHHKNGVKAQTIFSSSPSDSWRGKKNKVAEIRQALRGQAQ